MSEASKADPSFKIVYLEQLLREEGYLPKIDEDGDLVFKSEGKGVYIAADPNDSEYVRILMPNIWTIDSEEERDLVARVCSSVNKSVKVAKVFAVGDRVWVSVELFVSPIQSIHDVLLRCISVLNLACSEFVTEIRALQNQESFDSGMEFGDET